MLNIFSKKIITLVNLLKGNKGSGRKFDRLLQVKQDGTVLASDGFFVSKYYNKPTEKSEEIDPMEYSVMEKDVQDYNQNFEISIDDLAKVKFTEKIEIGGIRLETLENNFVMKNTEDTVELRTYTDTGLKGMIVVPKTQETPLVDNFPESIIQKFPNEFELGQSPFIGINVGNLLNVLDVIKRIFHAGESVTLHIIQKDDRKYLAVRAGRDNENFEAIIAPLAAPEAVKEERDPLYTDYVNF